MTDHVAPPVPPFPPPAGWTAAAPGAAAGAAPAAAPVGAIVAAALVGAATVPIAVLAALAGWVAEQAALVGLADVGWSWWPVVAAVIAVFVGGPAALLAWLPASPGVRAAGRAWLLAAVVAAALTLLRLVPAVHHELYLAAFTALAGGAAVALRRRTRRPVTRAAEPIALAAEPVTAAGPTGAVEPTGLAAGRAATPGRTQLAASEQALRWAAVAGGTALLLPWLWAGALGGLAETILAAAAAAALGMFAATVLDAAFWAAFGPGRVKQVLLGGSVAGAALLVLSAGTGQSGSHLAELLVLPPLGYALAALTLPERNRPAPGRLGADGPAAVATEPAGPEAAVPGSARLSPVRGRWPVGWLVAAAAFGPIAFTDAQEVTLLLTGRDVPAWTLTAAALSWVVAALLGALCAGWRARPIRRRRIAVAAAAVLLVAAAGVHLGAGQPGLYGERLLVILTQQADLSAISGTGPAGRQARVAEVYRRLVATATTSQADLRRTLDAWHLPYTPYYLVNAIEVTGGPGIRAWLSARPDVDRVLVTQRLRPLPAPPGGTTTGPLAAPDTPDWNITSIGADRVRTELKVDGAGITVGSSDSGVDGTHPALAANFRGGDDSWHDPWYGSRSPVDDVGHGTHTLGSAVGGRHVGVAPGAQWTACVNLDRNLGDPGHYLQCLQFMLAPFPAGGDPFTQGRPARAPHVLTNSWGCPDIEGCDLGTLRSSAAAFAAAGTYFVAAAGNSGPSCGTIADPPAPYAEVLTVGSVGSDGAVSDFSSRGPAPGGGAKPDVVAPGADVLSALPGGGYGRLSGTSMAAPHVAGVVALMWSAAPALVGDVDRTTAILRDTAVAVPDPGDACGQAAVSSGAGRVDAYAAVRAAQAIG
ncbi:MAG TPA: S8 family serine peptidase [Actinoplanes sp.]|nr:S8 family serine peptidase [Actinoplanes sp.]